MDGGQDPMQRAPVVARQRQRSASVSFASSAQDSIPSSPQPQPRRIWTSAPRSVTPLRPMDLGLSSPSPRLHRASASMTSPSSPPLQTHSPCAPSPLLWSPRRSRSYSIPESAKLASVQEPSAAGALDEGDDYDEDSSEGEDEAEAGEVYDWCALDTNASSAASASPFSSVVVLGSTSLLASNAGAGVVAPVAERLAYARPPAISIGSPAMTLSPGRSAQPSPPTDAASIIMDSTGERIIAAATPRAPPPTPDSSSIGSVNGRHWRSDSSWSLGSNSSTVASVAGGDGSVVKDTHEVVRRKASLPAVSPLGGPMLGGDCLLKSRCMVNQYALLDVLGTGSFGEVRLCLDTTTEERFAMKIVRKEREAAATRQAQTPPVDVMPADPSAPPPLTPRSRYHQQCEQLRSEIAVMKQLTHPNVIRLVEVMDDPNSNKMYLVLEYMQRGDLLRVLHGNAGRTSTCTPLGDHETWAICRQVASGLLYLHHQGVVHGDIKPQNLLVAQDGTVKIADFGLARVLQGEHERLVGGGGTPAFQGPEVCAGELYEGKAADMWALGATVFMIRCGRPPFLGEGALQLFHKIIHEPVVFPVRMCDGLRRLLEGMLEKDPSRRWTIEAVVSDPWLEQEWDEMAATQSPEVPHEWHCAGHSVSRSAFDPVLEAGGSVIRAAASIASSVPATHEVMDHQQEARRSMAFNYRPSSSSTSSRRRNPPANGTATRDERCPSSTSTEAADDESMEVLSVASHLDDMLDGLSLAAPTACNKMPAAAVAAAAALDWRAQSFPVRQAESTHNPATAVSVAWDSSRGRRQVQDDVVSVVADMGSLGTPSSPYRRPLSFVGLYDGHNGTAAAAFLHQHLPTALLRAPVSASIPEAMVAAAAELDAALCAHLAHERDPSGATALFAVVDGAAGPSQTLHVANVGDSKCVLSRNGGRAEALTREHRPARPDERSRIEAAGAIVHHDRVNGVLAVTRSFGDEGHKAGGDAKEGALICTPEITTRTVQPDWEFVLLASDGAWDVLGTQQAVDCVRSHLAHTPSLNSAAAAVVKETLARGSTDNVSVALLAFHQQQHGQGHGHGGWEEAAAWA